MVTNRQVVKAVCVLAVLALFPLASNADIVQLGTGFQVDVTHAGFYTSSGDYSVGMAGNGDFVVAWNSPDASSSGIYKRAFNADGSAKDAADVAVNTTTANEQSYASVAVRADGTYDIAWNSYGQDVAGMGSVVMRGYNADGTQRYGETSVMPAPGTSWPTDSRTRPEIAVYNNADTNDGALILGTNDQHNLYAGKTTQSGSVALSATQITNYGWTASAYHNHATVVADSGNGVFFGGDGYDSYNGGGDPAANRARYWIYDDSTATVAGGMGGYVAYTTANADGKRSIETKRWRADAAMNDAGQGIFVWMINDQAGTGSSESGNLDIAARRFHLSGATVVFDDAAQWTVNTTTANDQFAPQVAIDANGRFVVVWQDDDANLYGRAFQADGTAVQEFQINPAIVGTEQYYFPTVAAVVNGLNTDFVITYGGQDGGTKHVYSVLGSVVPEPSAMALLVVGAAGALVRRRRMSR